MKSIAIEQNISKACVRAALAALALAVIALGIAGKLTAVPGFEAYAELELAWSSLNLQLTGLLESQCWLKYAASLPADVEIQQTTFAQLEAIRCGSDSQTPTSVLVQGGALPSIAIPQPKATTIVAVPRGHILKVTGAKGAAPGVVTNVRLQIWGPLDYVSALKQTLGTLWNEQVLGEAQGFNNAVAKEEIYRWEVARWRVEQRTARIPPVITSKKPNAHGPTKFDGLSLSDLKFLVNEGHPPLENLNRDMAQDFRASLPNGPLDVDLFTAAIVVALGVALFMVILSAYVRAAVAADIVESPGTIFHALLGMRRFESIALLVLIVPPVCLALLELSIRQLDVASVIVGLSMLVTLGSAGSVARQLAPRAKLWQSITGRGGQSSRRR
ncbi:MAG: hypothetical protein ACREU3_01250 [Steroidobacteraceae bacterium]